jgi:hypothetical protein
MSTRRSAMRGKRVSGVLPLMMAVFTAGLVLAGCQKGLGESDIPYAASMVGNVLAGIADRDYARFSMDFSGAMKEAINEEGFPSMVAKLDDSLGEYRNRTFTRAVNARAKGKNYVIVTYRAEYEKDDKATITVYITDDDGTKLIEGFAAVPSGGLK